MVLYSNSSTQFIPQFQSISFPPSFLFPSLPFHWTWNCYSLYDKVSLPMVQTILCILFFWVSWNLSLKFSSVTPPTFTDVHLFYTKWLLKIWFYNVFLHLLSKILWSAFYLARAYKLDTIQTGNRQFTLYQYEPYTLYICNWAHTDLYILMDYGSQNEKKPSLWKPNDV